MKEFFDFLRKYLKWRVFEAKQQRQLNSARRAGQDQWQNFQNHLRAWVHDAFAQGLFAYSRVTPWIEHELQYHRGINRW
jgi:hypothetical protein